MAKLFDLEKFNEILEISSQRLRLISISTKRAVLSNNLILDDSKEITRLKKRIMSGDKVWAENFDKLYDLNIDIRLPTEQLCRKSISRIGGINCQIIHKNKITKNLNQGIPWNKGLKGKYPYSNKLSNESKQRISKANSGKNNGMFGKKMSQGEKDKKSIIMKEKILNGTFTPNSNNRNTHWDSYYRGKRYRSSWEALYQYFDPTADYESVRIVYTHNNQEFIYIVDFVNHFTKKLIEVKPQELLNDKKTKEKIKSAKYWCKQNNYEYIIVDKEYLMLLNIPDNLSDFDEKTQLKIRKLYETS